jgi:hypothetical protein
MNFSFRNDQGNLVISFRLFDAIFGEISLYFSKELFFCEPNILLDIFAILNGGSRVAVKGGKAYSFLSDQGLLHFAFLSNRFNDSSAKWRLSAFEYHEIRKDNGSFSSEEIANSPPNSNLYYGDAKEERN